ncbi:MAG: hypothetical protein ACLFSQ_08620 [Candidatus Zixiibacteriota bacterium]
MGIFIFAIAAFGQQILVDDLPMCGHHDRTTYQALWDSLTTAGATIDFTTDLGRYPVLDEYEVVIIMHQIHGFVCAYNGFTYEQSGDIIEFVCHGGNLIVMPIQFDGVDNHNILLNDPRWETGLYYGGSGGEVMTTSIEDYPPYTDGVEYLFFEISAILYAEPPAHPFVWDEDGENVVAAVSYPTSTFYSCSCEAGGRILALPDNHTFEAPVVGYIEPMDHRFILNAMLAMTGLGDTLDPCAPLPGEPIAEVDTCLYPGDLYSIIGDNLYLPMRLYIGGESVSGMFAADSSSVTFTVPDFPQGVYNVVIETDALAYDIGRIEIYCDPIEIDAIGAGCYNTGDTVKVYGENFTDAAIFQLISPDFADTIDASEFWVYPPDSGEFVVPATIDTFSYDYHYIRVLNEDIGNSVNFYIQIPCPCPYQSNLYSRGVGIPQPGDTRNPIVDAEEPDSCYILIAGPDEIFYSTNPDSFMAHPDFWPMRNPTHPIDIEFSSDGGSSWTTIASNLRNTGNFTWTPPDTGHDYRFIITATDSFGNSGADTIDVCVVNLDEPPLTGILRGLEECEPDSFIFIIRDSAIVDMATVSVRMDTTIYTYPDGMHWLNDTTLIFESPPLADSAYHWVHLSEMVRTDGGIRLIPDSTHATSSVFPIDLTPPVVEPIESAMDTVLDSLPSSFTFILTDWLGVDSTSIFITINGDTFYIDNPNLVYDDIFLTVYHDLLGVDIDTNHFSYCIHACDVDFPEECISCMDTCFEYRLTDPPDVEYLSPDSTVTSCARKEIRFLLYDDIAINWATVEMTAGDETAIDWADSRIGRLGDTLIFTPDSDWPSCESVYTAITYVEDSDGLMPGYLPVEGRFLMDLEPPTFPATSPMGRILDPSPTISVTTDDVCTGVDADSVWIRLEDRYFAPDSLGFSYSDPTMTLDLELVGIILEPFDTVTVCAGAADLAEECGANRDSICWDIYLYELECTLDVSAIGDTICFGDTAMIEAIVEGGFGAVDYEWSPSASLSDPSIASPEAFPEISTWYAVTAVDDSGCADIGSCYVYVKPLPEPVLPETLLCFGDTYSLSPGDGFDTYEWNTGDSRDSIEIVAEEDSALYWVDVSLDGCTARDSVWIYARECCTLYVSSSDTIICEGDAVQLRLELGGFAGDVEYLWQPDIWLDNSEVQNPVASPESSITYTAYVSHSEDCRDSVHVFIEVVEYPEVDIRDTLLCEDSTLVLTAPSGYESYLWSNGDTLPTTSIIADFDSEIHWVEVANWNCSVTDSFLITTEDCSECSLNIIASPDTVICEGTFAEIFVDAGAFNDSASFSWTPVSSLDDPYSRTPTASPDTSTRYRVIASIRENCADTAYTNVIVHPYPEISIDDQTICRDSVSVLHAGEGYETYLWNTSAETESIVVVADYDSMLYWVDVSVSGCISRASFWVYTEDCEIFQCAITVDAYADNDTICFDDSTFLHADVEGGVGEIRYEWSPDWMIDSIGIADPIVYPPYNSTWTVRVEDDSGCVAYDTVHVAAIWCGDTCFVHPKPITPNNDGINDLCKFEYPGMAQDLGTVYIYTLDNQFVRSLVNGDVGSPTQDGTILWDGRDEKGEMMKNGPYLYMIRVDEKTVCRGTVYIAR